MNKETSLYDALEDLYKRYNNRSFVSPDPLQFLYSFDDILDIEMAGLIASSLAYGNVRQIIRSVSNALETLGVHSGSGEKTTREIGFSRARKMDLPGLTRIFSGFKHRFTTGDELATLVFAVSSLQNKYGSMNKLFISLDTNPESENILVPLTRFCASLCGFFSCSNSLIPGETCSLGRVCAEDSTRKHGGSGQENHVLSSAAKRINLFMKWMVRKDQVDPGPWTGISPSRLIMPVDTHIYRLGKAFGFTARKNADMKTAMEITAGFRKIRPDDPLRYDFALTRLGIRRGIGDTELVCELYSRLGLDQKGYIESDNQ